MQTIYTDELLKFSYGYGGLSVQRGGTEYRSEFLVNPELIKLMEPHQEASALIKLAASHNEAAKVLSIISLLFSSGTLAFELCALAPGSTVYTSLGRDGFLAISLGGLGMSVVSLIPAMVLDREATGKYVDAVNAYNADVVKSR